MPTLSKSHCSKHHLLKFHRVSYAPADCLKNVDNGEIFIIGRQTDSFPASHGLEAKTEYKLLITGKDRDGLPFMRTKDLPDGSYKKWQLVHKNNVAVLSIWQINGTEKGQPYTVETIDAQDWTVPNPTLEIKRNVTVTLQAGDFSRILIRGYHTKQ